VAERLQELLQTEPLPGVDVLASTRAGFELIDMLHGYQSAIIVDCLDLPDPTPGRVRTLDMAHFAGSARLTAAHEISLSTAFELAATMGIAMPGKVEIFAVEGGDTRTLTEEMTPAVAEAVDPLACYIHALLKERVRSEEGAEDTSAEEGDEPPRRPFYGP
jgi:hydrogenase maturation protease